MSSFSRKGSVGKEEADSHTSYTALTTNEDNTPLMRAEEGQEMKMAALPVPAIHSESHKTREKLLAVLACLGWACVSSLLIMLNAHILRAEGFNYPILLCSLGQGFSGLMAFVLVRLGVYRNNVVFTPDSYARSILPIGLASAGTLALGNAGYLFLSVSFIQMLKAGTPVITMLVMFAFGLETARRDLINAVNVITIGCAAASWGELDFNIIGFTLIMLSEVCEALKTVATQKLLGTRFSGPMEGLYHTCPATFVCLLTVAAYHELPRFLEEDGAAPVLAKPHLFVLAGSLGFIVNLLTMEVIKRTNSLTFKIVGQGKNVAVVCLGVALLGNQITGLQMGAYAISIAGFFMYQKAMENKNKANAAARGAK
eukprot:comp21357_c0_seq1/m.29322 comp21357_c0_seq1/g.29322  ORF comp21357_c0_seq1/g.29322 comp21357_c0_seq1/m.29322 type:complete len:370 (-) comp21357_c0_seq1:39-1148(-)